MPFAGWTGAIRCVGGATPGARALMRWVLEHHPQARNLGIYNCRPVRGGQAMSCHAEGRALDVGFPMDAGRGSSAGYALVHELRPHAADLGIQAIIYDRRIWSAKSPGKAGRPYTGVNPHRDHVHVELTRGSGAKLTLATIRHVLDTARVPVMPDLRRGDRGQAVVTLQRKLGVTADGVFGARTETALNTFKRRRGWPADGVAGHRVWEALGL